MIKAPWRAGIFGRQAEIIVGDAEYLVLFTRHQMPFARLDAEFLSISMETTHRIIFDVNRMREQQHAVVIEVFLINAVRLGFHLRANGGAMSEKEIYHIDLLCEGGIG